ncbi:MAG: VCBS repeat-containing protein [Bacteroidetes bacterium]|nr:VCBS repeat-containing protein [Bacteroidota bacterium]
MRSVFLSVVALWGGALLLAGCASTGPAQAPDADQALFVREVEPFSVFDSTGRPYDLPFQGGFNVPRPQFADMDNDGDLDMFVQEESGRVIHFENTGTAADPRYTWRTSAWAGLDTGEWYRIVDLDRDGDMDVLTEERFSYIRFYENVGTKERPSFVVAIDTLLDATGTPIFADRQNIPHIVDIDCDGLLDLFIGRVTGTITRYESVGDDENGIPRFRFVTDRWEDIEIVGENVSLHGANTMNFADVDLDGDLDLFWGDFFEPGLLLVRNLGSCASPSLRSEPVSWPMNDPVATSGYNAPVLLDEDGDGDLDMVFGVLGGAFNANATTRDNYYLMRQDGNGNFTAETKRYLNDLDAGSESVIKFWDMDDDGDMDMIVGNKIEPSNQKTSLMFVFENTGSATAPSFRYKDTWDLISTYHQNPAIADLDADGDLDFLIGKWNKEMAYWRNDGSASDPSFTEVSSVYTALTRGQNAAPALADLDGDGDLDLVAGEASGSLNYWVNNGTSQAPQFELVSDTWLDIDIGRRSFPTFADIDADGDLDLIVGSELDGLYLYENTGTAQAAVFESRGMMDIDTQAIAAPEFVDIDGDGDLDLFIGGISGGILFYRNTTY